MERKITPFFPPAPASPMPRARGHQYGDGPVGSGSTTATARDDGPDDDPADDDPADDMVLPACAEEHVV